LCIIGGAFRSFHGNLLLLTGQNESAKSLIARNAPIKPLTRALLAGHEFLRLWESDSIPQLPLDGTPAPQSRYFPLKVSPGFAAEMPRPQADDHHHHYYYYGPLL
jgi:hypothetical protein